MDLNKRKSIPLPNSATVGKPDDALCYFSLDEMCSKKTPFIAPNAAAVYLCFRLCVAYHRFCSFRVSARSPRKLCWPRCISLHCKSIQILPPMSRQRRQNA